MDCIKKDKDNYFQDVSKFELDCREQWCRSLPTMNKDSGYFRLANYEKNIQTK